MSEEKLQLNLQLTWTDPRSGEVIEQVFDLPLSIGRDSKNTLIIPSTSVSRQHASLEFQGEKVILKDLGSSNGSYINGELVQEGPLADGDEMVLGEVAFKVEFTRQARTQRPTRDHLFGALLAGESEPTITLKSIKGKSALFADISPDSQSKIESPRPTAEVDAQRLSGDALKDFLGKSLQKDMESDISTDVQEMASGFRQKPEAETIKPPEPPKAPELPPIPPIPPISSPPPLPPISAEEKTIPSRPNPVEESAMNKIWNTLRRWFGN